MIWLTWRQFRGAAVMTGSALLVLAVALAVTGPGLASAYASGIKTCVETNDCGRFFDRFFDEYTVPFMAVTLAVLVLPALIGLFWGAPLITRELETGTHLLVWNQSVTRGHWLTVKLTVLGAAATAAACACGLAVTWWSDPLDKSAAPGYGLMDPLVFSGRGIAPMGYAVFAFALGVAVGMLVRRTLPAMAVTLALFAAVQLLMPLVVRQHLIQPVSGTFELSRENVDGFGIPRSGSPRVQLDAAIPGHIGAWVLSSTLVDPSGKESAEGSVEVSTVTGPCSPAQMRPPDASGKDPCMNEINRLGYRQQATYQPLDRFWPFQWIETGIYLVLAAALVGFCFWWTRRRLS